MTTAEFLILTALVLNCVCVCVCGYFMYKSTIKISAYKRSSDPWQAIALVNADKRDTENESEQPHDEDFATLPTEVDTDNLRSQL